MPTYSVVAEGIVQASCAAGVGRLGALRSLVFKSCSWLGDIGPNRPPWCPPLTGLTSLTELVFDHCPMLNTLPDVVRPHFPAPSLHSEIRAEGLRADDCTHLSHRARLRPLPHAQHPAGHDAPFSSYEVYTRVILLELSKVTSLFTFLHCFMLCTQPDVVRHSFQADCSAKKHIAGTLQGHIIY